MKEVTQVLVNQDRKGRYAKLPPPNKFSGGDHTSPKHFLTAFNEYIGTQNMTSMMKVLTLEKYIGEKVQTALNVMPDVDRYDIDKVQTLIRERWSDDKLRDRSRTTFHTRHQLSNESLDCFMDALVERRRKGWPKELGWSQSSSFREAVQTQFCNGLLDGKVKNQLNTTQQQESWDDITQENFVLGKEWVL